MTSTLLLTGAKGQLGQTIQKYWSDNELKQHFELFGVDIEDLELTDRVALQTYLDQLRPDIIVNAAAYTAVDRAEEEKVLAFAVNTEVVESLARWCQTNQAIMIHISTDFVFDGKSSVPYSEEAETNPLSVYGASKLTGENRLQTLLPQSSAIIRTSWLYSEYGSNFVKTMLRLMNRRDSLGVVGDQIGSPTSTHTLTKVVFQVIECGYMGILHWHDGGEISWYEFAMAIQQAGLRSGLLKQSIPLISLATAEYPTTASRPAYSVLDRSKALALLDWIPDSWRTELSRVVLLLAERAGTEDAKEEWLTATGM